LRNKFNAIKHHSTRLDISRSLRWNRPAKSHPGQTQGSGEKWKLVMARVTPYFDKVFATRQNLAECCAKCFAWCQPSVDTLLPTALLSMLRTLFFGCCLA
jgi:hypothetical protein